MADKMEKLDLGATEEPQSHSRALEDFRSNWQQGILQNKMMLEKNLSIYLFFQQILIDHLPFSRVYFYPEE